MGAKGKLFFTVFLLLFASVLVQGQGSNDLTRQTAVFESRKIPDSIIKALKQDPAYWYADLEPTEKKEKQKPNSDWLTSTWFRSLIWMLVIVGAVFIIIVYLRMSSFRLFTKGGKRLQVHKEATPAEDLLSTNYEGAIQQAIEKSDNRLAIRLLFLQTLKLLHENDMIHYSPGTTNAAYAGQVKPKERANKFQKLATIFEYAWYGHFSLDAAQFNKVHQQFLSFQKELSA